MHNMFVKDIRTLVRIVVDHKVLLSLERLVRIIGRRKPTFYVDTVEYKQSNGLSLLCFVNTLWIDLR